MTNIQIKPAVWTTFLTSDLMIEIDYFYQNASPNDWYNEKSVQYSVAKAWNIFERAEEMIKEESNVKEETKTITGNFEILKKNFQTAENRIYIYGHYNNMGLQTVEITVVVGNLSFSFSDTDIHSASELKEELALFGVPQEFAEILKRLGYGALYNYFTK